MNTVNLQSHHDRQKNWGSQENYYIYKKIKYIKYNLNYFKIYITKESLIKTPKIKFSTANLILSL
jgi:hypothetical protein